ncbi:MAG TPA: rhodanese-like domain-containing protein [Candidatus Limnocylindrales bacterium]|nr:rhodanese-like domain-containing protein [Candidatus Limnocylindrales bacterium]
MKGSFVIVAVVLAAVALAFATGVGPGPGLADSGRYIIEAKDVPVLLRGDQVVLVDMQAAEAYAAGHIEGAVNITLGEIVVNQPYPSLLAPAEQFAQVIGSRGIDNDTLIIIYDDNNNMDAARLWWSLRVYGHEQARVVSGGFAALQREGMALSTTAPTPEAKTFRAGNADESLIAKITEVELQVEIPQDNVILLDTRSREEFVEGTIPGAVMVDFIENNFADGTFRPVQQILIHYKERDITADNEIIIFCAVSVRGAQTFLALFNAGYRNLKLYDGGMVEYAAIHSPATGGGGADQPPASVPG